MSNHEIILCDYEGCTRPFAYRIQGFNLCSEHYGYEGLRAYIKLASAAVEEDAPEIYRKQNPPNFARFKNQAAVEEEKQ